MERNRDNIRKTDVILILAPVEGKTARNTAGLIDQRIFTGESKLHAVMDPQSCLWYMRYDSGILPPPLRQRFTSFGRLLDFAKGYFQRRDIKIVEIKD